MSHDKRYQVFISSTFKDLIEERQNVLKAVLELDHMPAGMELFPAGDETAWQLIKDVIDASDYYVLIIGGRYGSLDETGIGYTEKEYDYAVSSKKSVIPILHKNPNNLPRNKTEVEKAIWEKLEAFRNKVEKAHTCTFWSDANDLIGKVIRGLTSTIKKHPAIGWVRADKMPSNATLSNILILKQRIAELENELEQNRSNPTGTENLSQGEDKITFPYTYETFIDYTNNIEEFSLDDDTIIIKDNVSLTWNEIFARIAPEMINEVSKSILFVFLAS